MTLETIALFAVLAQSSFFSEVLEVRVTNVDVIVTAKDGKPVPGLKLEDFELYEDGVKKEITNFFEMREEAAPALSPAASPAETAAAPAKEPEDTRRRQIVILIDNAAIPPNRRNVILPHLEQSVKENVRKGDEVTILTWSMSLKAELEPTTDASAVEAALQRVAKQSTPAAQQSSELRRLEEQILFLIRSYKVSGLVPPWNAAIADARTYAMSASQQAHQRIEALKIVAASMRGTPGRKVLVFVTQGFSSNPAEEGFAFLDSVRDEFAGVDVPAMTHAREFEIKGLVRDVAAAANSSGVTLYPIDGSGMFADTGFTDASESRMLTNNPVIVPQTASITAHGIAAETGGVALYGSTNWKLAFDTIANDLNSYYSLGYRSTGEKSGEKTDRLKNIEVRLKNRRSYTVRARHAVIEPSAPSQMNDAVAAHLFREVSGNDLAIRATAGAATPADAESVVIPVTITIPTSKLTLLPDGADVTGAFSVYAAFLRKDGVVSKVARQPQNFRFPAESLKRRKEITVKIDVKADARTDGISVGILDDASRATGFAAVKTVAKME